MNSTQRRAFAFALAALVTVLTCTRASASVWSTTKSWSNEEEDRYSAWVQREWTQDVFKKGILKDLETDCADATYAMRALYSFENGLPMQITSGGSGGTWGETTSEFDSVPAGAERFRKFVRVLMDRTDTNSLPRDTYPVAMTRSALRAGTIYVEPGEHSYQVVDLLPQGVPVLMSSTTPKMNRILFRTVSFPFYRPESNAGNDGFRAFRWPQELNKPVRSLKRADFEQFTISGNVLEFAERVRQKLALQDETLAQRIDRETTNVCYFAKERAFLVIKGFVMHANAPGQCLTGSTKSIYETTIRDARLRDYFLSLRSLKSDPRWQTLDLRHKKILTTSFVEVAAQGVDDFETCEVQTGVPESGSIGLSKIWKSLEAGKIVSDPNVSIPARWGLAPAVSSCR